MACLSLASHAESKNRPRYAHDAFFTASDATCHPGDTATIDINLDNKETVSGYQLDIIIPKGFSYLKVKGLRLGKRNRSHNLCHRQLNDTTTRLIVMSADLELTGSSGPVIHYKIVADKDVAPGVYPITYDRITATNREAATLKSDKFTSTITVTP